MLVADVTSFGEAPDRDDARRHHPELLEVAAAEAGTQPRRELATC